MTADVNYEFKLVIVIREDLNLSSGKLAVQVAHAAVSCALRAKKSDRKAFSKWLKEGQKKVVLKVVNLKELEELAQKARSEQFIVEKITDAGLTEIPPGTVTCLGIGPAKEYDVDRITGKLKLA